MKRFLIILSLALCFAVISNAQPRAIGARLGATGFDASYQHTTSKYDFIEVDASLDFGYVGSGAPGFKATAIYNFVFARPAWSDRGTWSLYAGPGLSMGYVEDRVTYWHNGHNIHPLDYGFMFAFTGQIGLEYTFWFPLQLSVDIRPYFGIHANNGYRIGNENFGSEVGFYENGMMGFVPTLSVRYSF